MDLFFQASFLGEDSMRTFHLGDILSVTIDRLVSPSHTDGVYEILNYMTNDTLYSVQLSRAVNECKPWLYRQYPQLQEVETSEDGVRKLDAMVAAFDGSVEESKQIMVDWLEIQIAKYGRELQVEPIPMDDHDQIDPVTEAQELVGEDRVIQVEPPKDENDQYSL